MDGSDVLIIIGILLFGAGLFLIYPTLLLFFAGIVFVFIGWTRGEVNHGSDQKRNTET
ncbi:hypothetical protein [Alteribacillus sp. YIM 98480]|uniref:hypothetical protein n=1 Tax=Alteribacillus sp. YIM 98480 TaxID=2606599 RepID=UPI00131CCE8C|nr:hypothetical protein [Alteribacillus sp. YIM 98480]